MNLNKLNWLICMKWVDDEYHQDVVCREERDRPQVEQITLQKHLYGAPDLFCDNYSLVTDLSLKRNKGGLS